MEQWGYPTKVHSNKVYDEIVTRKLWEVSEKLTKVKYKI
jgi:hypothetical protein